MNEIPENYTRLKDSERRRLKDAKVLGPADEKEQVKVIITLRRRPDAPPMPDSNFYLKRESSQQRPVSDKEFVTKYGASEEDLTKVAAFARENGLNVIDTNAARRSVTVSGSVAQLDKTFGVDLQNYEHKASNRGKQAHTETFRGREGYIHVPQELQDVIEGVFGLDNHNITKRNSADPPNTKTLTTQQIIQLYNFPTNPATGQTIGIVSADGYQPADISSTFQGKPPSITEVAVNSNNSGSADSETTQDICIAGMAAPGADIVVYFHDGSQAGWIEMMDRIVHPNNNDPVCSVISSSFYISNGDDSESIADAHVSAAFVDQLSEKFREATLKGLTICIASGDTGSMSKVNDGKAHVQYPGSDPWVLSVGGTTIGNVNGSVFDEYVWNDPNPNSIDPSWGTTGGGISDHFALPSYQNGIGTPTSVNDNHVGRGVPDVAANASYNSGYEGIIVGGKSAIGNGTSASSPLWAGLIAVINAALGKNVGFVNPKIYALGSAVFRDIVPGEGPADNSNSGVTGYPAKNGWDACTGWGSINGNKLLEGLRRFNQA